MASWYLLNLLLIGYFLAPPVYGLITGHPTAVDLFLVVAGVAVIIVAMTSQDLVLTPTGLLLVWIPAVWLALARGPFAVWLRRGVPRRQGQAST